MERSVITVACGNQIYFDLASNLARSFRLHNSDNGINFTVITDNALKIPKDISQWAKIVQIESDEGLSGFELKLLIGKYSSAKCSLFIDADCIVVGSLQCVFHRFSGLPFTAIGDNPNSGEWFGEICSRLHHLGVETIPRFVGAVYYFETGPISAKVFQEARRLADEYDSLGLVRLRGKMNEEPLISMGMAVANQKAVTDDGTIKADAMCFSGKIRISVRNGKSLFETPKRMWPLTASLPEVACPLIAHFNDYHVNCWQYRTESCYLELVQRYGLPDALARVFSQAAVALPVRFVAHLKEILRPMYRQLIGIRKITSDRL